jgi:cbb3-type cytochrome oxidase subunit 3
MKTSEIAGLVVFGIILIAYIVYQYGHHAH